MLRGLVLHVDASAHEMRVSITYTESIEKPGLFSRALLTYTLALAVVLDDEELAAIEQKNIYARVLYEPPWHPLWRIPEDELPPAFLVYHLVQIHEAETHAAIGYFPDDHSRSVAKGKLLQSLEQLKEILSLTRRAREEYEL